MSSTSDQTTQQSKKTRLIIGEIGVDTETGIVGKGHSYDNGKTFTVDDTIYGRIYNEDDHNRIWQGIQNQVDKVVEPAKSAADSAVAYANDAIEKSKVNSQAIDDINSAVSDAKQGANDAMSRAMSAWDVATGAKSAVTDFDPLLKQAQSDAGKALTQIADTAIALSDAKTAFSSDVAVAKNLANTAQTTADNAVKSASSVADDLTAVANQAKANANGITKVTSDVGLLQTTVADNSGNISTIKETAKQIQQAVSDNAGNITVAKQTADSAVAVASDAKNNATVAIQTASQASITAKNASGQAASAVITANGAMTTASDAKSNATVAVQTASGASLTATNANSDATVAKQTASEAKIQASNAESDFAQLSIRANKIEANVANNSGAIASVQQTANGLTTTVADIKANGGGVNLITGTSRDLKTAPDSPSRYNGGYIHAFSSDELSSLAGNQVTARAFIHNTTAHTVNLVIWIDVGGFGVGTGVPAGTDGYSTITAYNINPKATKGDISVRSYTENAAISGVQYKEFEVEKGTVAHDWSPAPEDLQNQFTQTKQSIDGITTTINDPKTGLNATYQTASGNATTISNVKSDVYQLETTASGLTSRVGNLESKTNTQETAIEQNKNAISLKADQTSVDTINGTVNQLQSSLTVQAGQIQEKVTSSQVTGMLTGYATQDYTQSLVTQKANDWNLNLTSLKTDVNAIKTTGGGVNLWINSKSFANTAINNPTVDWNTGSDGIATAHITSTTSSGGFYGKWNAIYANSTEPFAIGDSETFSVEMKGSGTFTIGREGDFTKVVTLTSNWTRYAVSGTVNSANKAHIIYHAKSESCDAYVRLPMVEKGTVAHDWSPAPSDMATVTSVTNLSATVDGIQAQVYNSDGSSRITQLSNLIVTKVSSDDFNNLSQAVNLQTLDSADINTMKTNGHYFVHNLANNPIGGWVYVDVVGNGVDRIRQDVYQDSYTQHCYRRWYGNSWTDWSQGATESDITQLSDAINLRVKSADLISQINLQAGTTLIQSNKLVLDAGTTVFTGNAFIPSAAISSISADKIMLGSTALWNTDGTLNLVNSNAGITSKITVTQGNVNFDGVDKNASIIKFASDNNTNAFTVNPTGATVTPTLFFERFDQTVGHWLGFTRNEVEHEGVTFHTWDDDGQRFFVSCHARFDKNLSTLGTFSQGQWDGTTAKPEAGVLTIKGGNTIWSGSNFLAIGDNLSNTYTNVMAKSFSQQSTLSSKTNIEEVDPKYALDLVNRTDILSYQYKADVAQGKTKRYTSMILDDVNDVSKYYAPDEFANEERTGRDDGSAVGYLFLAVKELTRRIKTLEEKLNG